MDMFKTNVKFSSNNEMLSSVDVALPLAFSFKYLGTRLNVI